MNGYEKMVEMTLFGPKTQFLDRFWAIFKDQNKF